MKKIETLPDLTESALPKTKHSLEVPKIYDDKLPSSESKASKYRTVLDETETDPALLTLAKKRVEDMTMEELRKVYFNISAQPGERLYSNHEVNIIENTGSFSEPGGMKPTESMFIGTEVHSAMETRGESLSRLKTYKMVGDFPELPDFGLSSSLKDILQIMGTGSTRVEAYATTRNNAQIKAVEPDDLTDYYMDCHKLKVEPDVETLSKPLKALVKKADKDTELITNEILVNYKAHLVKVAVFNKKKSKLFKSDDIVIDELPFIKSAPDEIFYKIESCYRKLSTDMNVSAVYNRGVGEHGGDVYTEIVVLWSHELSGGKVVQCKSMLDRIVVNHKTKQCTVSDIKTHSFFANQFIYKNYKSYKYFRSMSFYREAAMSFIDSLGYESINYKIDMVLLPISTERFEVGSYFPTLILSSIDLESAKEGGYFNKIGSSFNAEGEVQVFLDYNQFVKLCEIGLVSQNSLDLVHKGWSSVIKEYESKMIL
jgi:hypothetical protein